MSSPFLYYNACFDPQTLIRRYAMTDLKPVPGYLTNFLGVKIDPKFVPDILLGREGQLDNIPIPANWHSDVAEWGAALRAVDTAAGPEFVLVELGCGWGCWMNNAGTAAKKRSLRVRLIGVEGDEGHCRFAHESLKLNGFEEDEFEVRRGIAAAKPGTALFPRQAHPGLSWGLQPVFGASDAQVAEAIATKSCDILPIISLEEVFAKHERIDLLHVDIQGGELDLVEQSISILGKKVVYLLIGTHSREIEGGLFKVLIDNGWQLEIERPGILSLQPGRQPIAVIDGVQGWRNTSLQKKIDPPRIVGEMSFSVADNDFFFSSYFLGSGWSALEPKFVWSDGKEAECRVRFESGGRKSVYFNVMAFLPTAEFTQRVEITANHAPIGTMTLTAGDNRGRRYFDLPEDMGDSIVLKLLIERPISPQETGISNDSRKLGVALFGFGVVGAKVI